MRRRNFPIPAPRTCSLAVESLEDRWLLSGVHLPVTPSSDHALAIAEVAAAPRASAPAASPESTAVQGRAVEVVTFGVAPDDGEGDIEIAPSEVPHEIVGAIDGGFPGAELVAVVLDTDGDTQVYEVNADWRGHSIDVTLTSDGNIIESKRTLTASELPQPVLDWVRQNFPGAVIGEAELVADADIVSYDLRFATLGQPDYEATLRIQDAGTPAAAVHTLEAVRVGLNSVLTTFNTATAGPSGPASAPDTTAEDHPVGSANPRKPESVETVTPACAASDSSREQAESQWADSIRSIPYVDLATPQQAPVGDAEYTSGAQNRAPMPFAMAMRVLAETAASAGTTAWLPQVAGMLSDVLPIDVAAVERGLQQLLDEINSLAYEVACDTAAPNAALRLAVIASLITGVELVILDSRKPNREPAIESSAANSSWSWILGAATPRRP